MPTGTTARELFAAGDEALTEAAFRTGDFAEAQQLLETARAQASAGADREAEACAIDRLGMLIHYQNITTLMSGREVAGSDSDAEEELFRRALGIRQELGDSAGTAQSLFGVGLVLQVLRRDWAAAMPYFWQALDLAGALTERGDLYTYSEIHRHVGFYFLAEDVRPDEAVRHLQISLDLRERLGDPRRIPSALVALGQAELAAGNRQRAVGLLSLAVTRARQAGLLPARIEDAEQALREARVP